MDIIYKGKTPILKIPYFGQQSRFFKFFYDAILPYLNKYNVYAETNSGSNSNAFSFAKKGHNVIVNDVGEYSNTIANAIFSDSKAIDYEELKPLWLGKYANSYLERASVFAGLMYLYGYNAKIPAEESEELKESIEKYRKHLTTIKNMGIHAKAIYNLDLFNYLQKLHENNTKVDVMFMDFAWPWRDGEKTLEYETSANELSNVFNKKYTKVEIWDKNNVIENVIKAVNLAKKVSRYVFLSNQSSNYPTPEILEINLLLNNINYLERHTMLTNAANEDNLNKDKYFREYLYVIKGDLQ